MSGPSLLHEDRVTVLADLGELAGFTLPAAVGPGASPDLVRLHYRLPEIFVADAKATESPGDVETRLRLLAYARAGRKWRSTGFVVRLALCHGPDLAGGWLRTLTLAAEGAGMSPGRAWAESIDEQTWVSTVVVR